MLQNTGRYTVEHHRAPDAKDPPPRWDATRQSHHKWENNPDVGEITAILVNAPLPGPSRKKEKRILHEGALRMRYQSARVGAYCKAEWNSLRPAGLATSDMPYFEYLDWSASPMVGARLGFDYATKLDGIPPASIARGERRERCTGRAWETGTGMPYVPLGGVLRHRRS